jgi:hypothetical protein
VQEKFLDIFLETRQQLRLVRNPRRSQKLLKNRSRQKNEKGDLGKENLEK